MNGNAGNHADCHCHYHRDLIVVRRDDVGPALEILNQDIGDGTPAVELDEGELNSYIDGLNGEEIATVVELIGLLRVTDPHFSADQLVNAGIEASPIHGVGFMGHANYKGDDFHEVLVAHPQVEPATGDQVIAVVDSGLAPDEDLPDWLHQPSVLVDRPQDTDVLTDRKSVV